jgi:hypothetical protein
MNVADVLVLCFDDNAHEIMVHMLMSCSYGCTDARQTPGVLQPSPLIKILSRDLENIPFFKESRIVVL